jgi:hypothetical protein
LIIAGRVDEFKKSIAESMPVVEFRLRQVMKLVSPQCTDSEKTTLFQREILPLLRSVKLRIELARYVALVVTVHPLYIRGSTVAEAQIWRDIDGNRAVFPAYNTTKRFNGRREGRGEGRIGTPSRLEPVDMKIQMGALEKAEIIIIQALLDKEFNRSAIGVEQITPKIFTRTTYYRLAEILLNEPGDAGVRTALNDAEFREDNELLQLLLGQEIVPGLSVDGVKASIEILTKNSEEPMLAKLREMTLGGNVQANELYTKIMRQRKGGAPVKKLTT